MLFNNFFDKIFTDFTTNAHVLNYLRNIALSIQQFFCIMEVFIKYHLPQTLLITDLIFSCILFFKCCAPFITSNSLCISFTISSCFPIGGIGIGKLLIKEREINFCVEPLDFSITNFLKASLSK